MKYKIEFLNAKKGFKKEAKIFVSYDKAKKWGAKNLPNFFEDMIRAIY